MEITIRPARQADAAAMGRLYQRSTAYLRALGCDTTDFQFGTQTYVRDGFGPDPWFTWRFSYLETSRQGHASSF